MFKDVRRAGRQYVKNRPRNVVVEMTPREVEMLVRCGRRECRTHSLVIQCSPNAVKSLRLSRLIGAACCQGAAGAITGSRVRAAGNGVRSSYPKTS
jgi:hypothetical protein